MKAAGDPASKELALAQNDTRDAKALPIGWVLMTLGEITDTTRKRKKSQERV
jgi:hypothetical protein